MTIKLSEYVFVSESLRQSSLTPIKKLRIIVHRKPASFHVREPTEELVCSGSENMRPTSACGLTKLNQTVTEFWPDKNNSFPSALLP